MQQRSMVATFGFEGGICLLIAPVPVHCFLITFRSPSVPNYHSRQGFVLLCVRHHSYHLLKYCQTVCDALSYLLKNINIKFGTYLYIQIVGFPSVQPASAK